MAFTITFISTRIYDPNRQDTDESPSPRGYDRPASRQTLANRQSLTWGSNADDRPLGFDLAELIEAAGTAARANLARGRPGFGRPGS